MTINSSEKRKVLFICTHNSARSQMAEGLLRHIYGKRFEVMSAGTQKTSVKPQAITVMSDMGIDISSHESKTLERFLKMEIDYVITVCDNAKKGCPFFPGGKHIIHHSFEDPSDVQGSEEEKLEVFRRSRDEIRDWIEHMFDEDMKILREGNGKTIVL